MAFLAYAGAVPNRWGKSFVQCTKKKQEVPVKSPNLPLTSLTSSTLAPALEKRRRRLMTRLYEVELRKFHPESEQFECIVALMAMLYANPFPPADMKQYESAVDTACEEDISFVVFQKLFNPEEFGESMKKNQEVILRHYREEIAPDLLFERILKLPMEGAMKDEFQELIPHLIHGSQQNFAFGLRIIALLEKGDVEEACKKVPSFMQKYGGEVWKLAHSPAPATKPVVKTESVDPIRRARLREGGFYDHALVVHAETSTRTWRN